MNSTPVRRTVRLFLLALSLFASTACTREASSAAASPDVELARTRAENAALRAENHRLSLEIPPKPVPAIASPPSAVDFSAVLRENQTLTNTLAAARLTLAQIKSDALESEVRLAELKKNLDASEVNRATLVRQVATTTESLTKATAQITAITRQLAQAQADNRNLQLAKAELEKTNALQRTAATPSDLTKTRADTSRKISEKPPIDNSPISQSQAEISAQFDATQAQIKALQVKLAAAKPGTTTFSSLQNQLSQLQQLVVLDFPNAMIDVSFGGQTIQSDVRRPTGEAVSNGVYVRWTVTPSVQFGDEYIFTISGRAVNPKTFSAIFNGGYIQVAHEGEILIALRN